MNANCGSLHERDAYGRTLARKLGADDGPVIVTRSLQGSELAVTEIRVDRPIERLSDPIAPEDGYMICYMLLDLPSNYYWEEGRQVSSYSLRAGDATLHDLRREPQAVIDKPVHSLLFYLPRTALNALADKGNQPYISELRYEPGVAVIDETLKHVSLSLLPALRHPDRVSRLFKDHVTLAFASHIAQAYGDTLIIPRPVRGGLAPWQEKRSKEMLSGDLTGSMPLRDIAGACGLSVSYFSRAFKRTTGLAPHAWLLQLRVESAKSMLRGRDKSLCTVALACGFADQSHFTRVFRREVGLSPGVWRKVAVT